MDDDELNKLFSMDSDEEEGEDAGVKEDGASSSLDDMILDLVEIPYDPDEEDTDDDSSEEDSDQDETDLEENGEYEESEEEYEDEDEEEETRREFHMPSPNFDFVKDFPLDPKSTVFLILAISVVVLVVLVATLPAFRISNIEVRGNYVLKSDELIAESGINYGSHIFFADYNKAAKIISSSSPYVRGCKVTFTIPSTVIITVDERSKIANVKTPDGYAALDDQGIVLELSSGSPNKVSPVISGLNITHATVGKKIVIRDESDYQKALIVLGSLLAADMNGNDNEYSIFENTREVRVLPSGYIFLTVRLPNSHTLQVKMDSLENISTHAAWLKYVIDSNVFDNGFPSGALDMTGDEYIYREFSVSEDMTEDETRTTDAEG